MLIHDGVSKKEGSWVKLNVIKSQNLKLSVKLPKLSVWQLLTFGLSKSILKKLITWLPMDSCWFPRMELYVM